MTTYRGKHSRPSSDSISNPEQPRSTLQPVKHPGRVQVRRARVRHASPDAFKHHDAVLEDGTGARHSKTKTLLIVIPIIVVLAAALVIGGIALNNYLNQEESITAGLPVTVTIPEGASTNEIANLLKESNVVSSVQSFTTEVRQQGVEQSLKSGTYELTTLMDMGELIDALVLGPLEGGSKLTIPEGLTVEQTARTVEEATGIPQAEFLSRAYAASDYVADYPFLTDVYNNSLEGFLYPKTYTVPEGAKADDVVRMLLDQFAMETSTIDFSAAEERGLSIFNVITLASLVERETAIDEERAQVSSVMYNRLRDGMMLQIDATVVYALGDSFSGEVTYDDLEIDSPYNTYKTYELPAGPICSPSILSIEAAAHPADTNFYYYVLSSTDGHHTFCETEEEFLAAKEEYNELFGIE